MRRKEREITDIAEIGSIISRCDVCRIALSDNNIPYIVTMNFGYTGGSGNKLYFHCAREGEEEEKKRGLDSIMSHYSDRVDFNYKQDVLNKTIVLRLDIGEMKGKKC